MLFNSVTAFNLITLLRLDQLGKLLVLYEDGEIVPHSLLPEKHKTHLGPGNFTINDTPITYLCYEYLALIKWSYKGGEGVGAEGKIWGEVTLSEIQRNSNT